LTSASNRTGAAAKTVALTPTGKQEPGPSVIIVEVLGYGGADTCDGASSSVSCKSYEQQNFKYNPNSAFQVVGAGVLSDEQVTILTVEEKVVRTDGERQGRLRLGEKMRPPPTSTAAAPKTKNDIVQAIFDLSFGALQIVGAKSDFSGRRTPVESAKARHRTPQFASESSAVSTTGFSTGIH
jgi:hypothetical protein